ncbi:glycosyl transferase family 1 [Streptacidiphilus pinicola]|uniref:Glycosyl transferase family 1 n=1 Tax=Streptacidiphilus pinicola TaxID=2219663 RepID=A0A2X0ILG7_9ACTN|nr:GNAT family N-acetyltransferase [Streptacidiphilus pinicola]RAG85487.1 glycosyl transferase family 1 [Streptacidiphilus pinicola]
MTTSVGSSPWSVVMHKGDRALADFDDGVWDDLVDRCSAATPFQCYAWLESWWRSYGRPGRLRLVLVHHRGRLVGAAPLILRLRPFPVLVPIGAGLSDFGDVLLDDDLAEQTAEVLAQALARTSWTLVDLREVRANGAAQHLYRHWPGVRWRLPDSVCQRLPGVPMEELLQRLPGRSAKRMRAKLRKLDSAGVVARATAPHEVPDAVASLLRLHKLQWEGRRVTPEHLHDRFATHLTRAAASMVGSGRANVRQFLCDGELIACHFNVHGPDFTGTYLYGVLPTAREHLDISGMLLRECLAHAHLTGRSEVNLLRGTEPYKERWRPEQARNERLLMGGWAAMSAFGSALWLRTRIVQMARRQPWLVQLRSRLRVLASASLPSRPQA